MCVSLLLKNIIMIMIITIISIIVVSVSVIYCYVYIYIYIVTGLHAGLRPQAGRLPGPGRCLPAAKCQATQRDGERNIYIYIYI